jgi:cysteine-rich repeat protein
VTHTLADLLGHGAAVAEPLKALNLNAYCTAFGGDGVIDSVEEWLACVVAASTRAANTVIAAIYPRVLEWLDLLRPALEALRPPEDDPHQMADALAALDALRVALDGQSTHNTAATCGNGIVEPGEECDWTNLNNHTCAEQGFVGGTLACTPGQCTFDTSDCSAIRFLDNGDGTITDVQMGLMWEKKDDAGDLHDKDLILRWQDELPEVSIHEWLSELNGYTDDPGVQAGFAGHTDWRLPTLAELQTIVALNNAVPSVEPIFNTGCTPGCTGTSSICSCTAAFVYWSSTAAVSNPLLAWTVLFFDGSISTKTKDDFAHVRAVRSVR